MSRRPRLLAVVAAAALSLASSQAPAADPPPATQPAPDLSSRILTPPPPATPRINGPRVYGERPGRPFLYTIPATGERPMTFSADGLPDGLSLNGKTGRITGSVANAGEFQVTLRAK